MVLYIQIKGNNLIGKNNHNKKQAKQETTKKTITIQNHPQENKKKSEMKRKG